MNASRKKQSQKRLLPIYVRDGKTGRLIGRGSPQDPREEEGK